MDKSKISRNANLLFWLCFIAYSFSCVGRMNFSVCMSSMVANGLFSKTFGGTVMTAYLICYGSGQLINGVFGNKISPKYMISIGLIGAGATGIVMGFITGKFLFITVWALNGLFNSMLWAPIIRVFSEWLPDDKRYGAGVWMAVAIPFGTTVSYLISSFLLKAATWQSVFFMGGSFSLVASVVWIVGIFVLRPYIAEMSRLLQESRQSAYIKNDGTAASGKHSVPSLMTVILTTGLVFISVAILFNGALKDAVVSWIPAYISEEFGVDVSTASLVAVILPIISVFGSFAATFLNRRVFKNEMLTSALMFVLSVVSTLCVFLFGKSNIIAATALLAVSVAAMWGVDTMLLTFVPYHYGKIGYSSAVSGLLDCFAYAASSVCSAVYGIFEGSFGWNYTILLWSAFALAGAAVCVATSFMWKKQRSLYEIQ